MHWGLHSSQQCRRGTLSSIAVCKCAVSPHLNLSASFHELYRAFIQCFYLLQAAVLVETGHSLKVMVILEGTVVEAEAFQLSSFANAVGLAAPCIDDGPLNSSRFFFF